MSETAENGRARRLILDHGNSSVTNGPKYLPHGPAYLENVYVKIPHVFEIYFHIVRLSYD